MSAPQFLLLVGISILALFFAAWLVEKRFRRIKLSEGD
jgi:hypothetical protein